MPRINRRTRALNQTRRSRPQILELLLGPNGDAISAFKSDQQKEQLWEMVCREISEEFAEQWYHAQADPKDFSAIAEDYARSVVSGKTLACKKVKMACQRHLDDLSRAAKDWKYRFDKAKADRVCRFAELMPHIVGEWAANGELIVLQPWQIFCLCCIFGWVKVETGKRRFTLAYIEVGRKNAKSTLAAIIGDYMFACDGEFGAQIFSGATKEDQAMEVFRPALQMFWRNPELKLVLGIEIETINSKKMRIGEDNSRFEVVVRDPGDGSNPHCGIVDEYHEHDTDTLFDTFRTGMAARKQPLELVITTAGFNIGGPCMALHRDLTKMLEGSLEREEAFAIIYSLDPEDDWTDESLVSKPNPNFGISVDKEFLLTELRSAKLIARKQNVYLTKHACIWCGSNVAFFNLRCWRGLADETLKPEHFLGSPCVVSLDLASRNDFMARVLGFRKIVSGKNHFYLFGKFYLPRDQVDRPENQHYQGWEREKFLTVHRGGVVDYELVEEETVEEIQKFRATEFAYDPRNADQFGQNIGKKTKATPVEVPQNVQHLSAAMKETDSLIIEGRIHHDGNPILTWMIGNVIGRQTVDEDVLPGKDCDENKIDGAVAVIMAIGRLMVAAPKRSVYATRGLLTLSAKSQASPGMYA